jgi:hypothetical protein
MVGSAEAGGLAKISLIGILRTRGLVTTPIYTVLIIFTAWKTQYWRSVILEE